MNKIVDLTDYQEPCELCEVGVAQLAHGKITFHYGAGEEAVELTVNGPVWECETCGGRYTGEGAEEMMHDAVCDHLGRLRPSQIRKIRSALGMSQRVFGEHSEIGVASIKRWEAGTQIQSKVYDGLLRFYLSDIENQKKKAKRSTPIFRTKLEKDRHAAADAFKLAA